ncbi:hypothetical protein [Flavobacterium sp.]|uniref:hypothetical protein n=1 Tax=Flavobacterium sp. TaxID=239 RepID=UPI00120794FA|nr:hypothetical protein [Flavobacterium sp.]RZJ71452.1 MAG: hypothetical protein EOO49_10355 [Flavobacterium sp.]
MKKITPILFLLSLISCGVQKDSIVDYTNKKKSYTNVIFVMPYRKFETKNYINNLKEELDKIFASNQKKVEIITFENEKEGLKLNQDSQIQETINAKIKEDAKDLLLILRPTNMMFTDGALQDFEYEIVGIDTSTKKEVWKGEFRVRGQFGPSTFLKKSANGIYEELVGKSML